MKAVEEAGKNAVEAYTHVHIHTYIHAYTQAQMKAEEEAGKNAADASQKRSAGNLFSSMFRKIEKPRDALETERCVCVYVCVYKCTWVYT